MKLLKDLFTDYRFTLSFVVLMLIMTMAILSFFSPYDPTIWHVVPRDLPPSGEHLLGTDTNGQDIFWQATFAVRNSLIIALISGLVSRVIAILVGMIAGYSGGTLDRVLMFIGFAGDTHLPHLCHVSHDDTGTYESGAIGIDARSFWLGMGRTLDSFNGFELA